MRNQSVDLIATSPPFLDVVDYRKDNWLRCWFAGIGAGQLMLDTHRSVLTWMNFVRASFTEHGRVVRRQGRIAFEVGEVRHGRVLLEKAVLDAIAHLPFELSRIVINRQRFTKTAHCWSIKNNQRGTNTNRIIVLRRG